MMKKMLSNIDAMTIFFIIFAIFVQVVIIGLVPMFF